MHANPTLQPSARRALGPALLLALIAVTAREPMEVHATSPCDPPVANPIACENSKPGNDQIEWDSMVPGKPWGDPAIQGFATEISLTPGQTVHFKVKTDPEDRPFHLDIYRFGYYGGKGARRVAAGLAGAPRAQPACGVTDAPSLDLATNQAHYPFLLDCGNWQESAAWTIPADAVSGVYFAKLIRDDVGSVYSRILFVVREPDAAPAPSDILFQTSDTTWQAYNRYPYDEVKGTEGHSLYDVFPGGPTRTRAFKVSYNRPFICPLVGVGGAVVYENAQESFFFANEYPMLKFLEANGYRVSYLSGVDADRRGALILRHKVLVTVGHDEYWSAGQRANVLAARDHPTHPVHLASFSGNEDYWKTSWESSWRTLVCFKEQGGERLDPQTSSGVTTSLWRDSAYGASSVPPLDGYRPENLVTGQLTAHASGANFALSVPAEDGRMRFWRGISGIANLANGQRYTSPSAFTVGYEFGEAPDSPFRPGGVFNVSTTHANGTSSVLEAGLTSVKHNMTLFRAPSGALVFGAGTIQYTNALDDYRNLATNVGILGWHIVDAKLQQAVVNLLADMGTQPTALRPGLTAASTSLDTTPPSASVVGPASGFNLKQRHSVAVEGVASDGDGRVAAVEVSLDGGISWRPAEGRESWTYRYTGCSAPGTQASFVARAIDDSGNVGAWSGPTYVNVVAATANDFIANGTFECGFETVNNPSASGQLGRAWQGQGSAGGNGGTNPVGVSNALAGVTNLKRGNIQRVVSVGPGTGLYQDLTLTPQIDYVVKARVLAEAGRVRVAIGPPAGPSGASHLTSTLGQWESVVLGYRPAETSNRIAFYADVTGTVFKLDDVSVAPVAPPPNQVANGDFESGFAPAPNPGLGTGQVGQGWVNWANTNVDCAFVCPSYRDSPNVPHAQDVDNAGPGDGIAQDVTLVPGRTYALSARVWVRGWGGQVKLSIGEAGVGDSVRAFTTTVGQWQTIALSYTPAQAPNTLVVYANVSDTGFTVDDVVLNERP